MYLFVYLFIWGGGVFLFVSLQLWAQQEFFSIRYSYLYNIYTEIMKECYGAFTPGPNSSLLIASVTGVLDGCAGSLKRTKFGLYG